MSARLEPALQAGLSLPDTGLIAVFAATPEMDLSELPQDRVQIIQGFIPFHQHFEAAGFDTVAEPSGRYAFSLVCLPRSKPQAHAMIWQALMHTDGVVAVDGMKVSGIDGVFKAMRTRVPVSDAISKAHGKLFWLTASPDDFADWVPRDSVSPEGWVTAPGCFSADGPDPASVALAEALPAKLGKRVVDLGGGWGYLSANVLNRPEVTQVDLVEAEHVAIQCARRNVTDPRVRFHWADALQWSPETPPDTVVMNPPFHTGRAADPALGRDFVAAAARILPSHGVLWMVANRHLPYESTLEAQFGDWAEVAGDNRFKILRASRPTRHKRRSRLS